MKRIFALGTLVMVGTLTMAAGAVQQPAPPAPSVDNITVEKVKDNLFVMRGGGGNSAVFVTANGVTLVDTKNPGWGQPLLDKIKTVTDKPVTTVINTHTHYDHVSGNVALPATVEIIAHENTAKLMTQMNPVLGIGETPNVFKDNPGKGMPKRTFKDKLTIGKGADQINLYYFGPAHTGGDAFVEFPAHRIMHVRRHLPEQGPADHGQEQRRRGRRVRQHDHEGGERRAQHRLHHQRPHAGADHARRHEASSPTFVREFVTTVQAGKKAGKTVDEVAKAWVTPAKYTGFSAPPAIERVRAYVQIIFDETK